MLSSFFVLVPLVRLVAVHAGALVSSAIDPRARVDFSCSRSRSHFPTFPAFPFYRPNKYLHVFKTLLRRNEQFDFTEMSQVLVFSLLGDSNVIRNMTPFNCRDRPVMKDAQVIPCGRLDLLAEALRQIRSESNVCLMSCVTNFLTGSGSANVSGSVSQRIDHILLDFVRLLNTVAADNPESLFLVSPPMYRMFPIWYRDGMPEVLKKFSDAMRQKVPNIHLLPSFATPSFESDGVHLTPYSGLEFLVHLFDASQGIIDSLKSQPEEVLTKNCESSRVLEDRMMALEQDHRRLNNFVESKTAEDAELAEMNENILYENHFMISGLKRLPKLSPKEWQERAKADITSVLKTMFPDRSFNILYVKNASGLDKEKPARYQVRMDSVASSKEIRDKFGSYFWGNKDERPAVLKEAKLSISNRLTHESRVRLMVLRVLADHYLEGNPGSKVQVIKYGSRPLLKIFPAQGAKDPRVMSMNYIEAVRTLPVNFSSEELEPILREIKPKWHGKVRSLFIVLSDDMIKKKFKSGPKSGPAENTESEVVSPDHSSSSTATGSKGSKGSKTGKSRSGRSEKRSHSPSGPTGTEKHRK